MLFKKTGKLADSMAAARAQVPAAGYIPYAVPLSDGVVKLRENGELCATWRLQGIPFETVSPEEIASAKRQLVNFLHAIRGTDQADPTAVWIHRVRRRVSEAMEDVFPSAFAQQVNEKWCARLLGNSMLRNELYFSLLLRPLANLGKAEKRYRRTSAASLREFDSEALRRFELLCNQVSASMGKYGGVRLRGEEVTTATGNKLFRSDQLTFYRMLLTGEWTPVFLEDSSIYDYLCDRRIFAGDSNGIVQVHGTGGSKFIGYLDLQDYPELSEPGMNNCLFMGNYEFVETQSFSYLGRREGVESLQLQQKRLISGGEGSPEQISAIDAAVEELRNGRVLMGEYHYTLGVFGKTVEAAQKNMAMARTTLNEEAGYKVSTVDLIPECAHFAQLPGNWRWRPREAKLTSRNLACMAPLHNFELGKPFGNPWGRAITLLATPSGQGYYVNFHESPLGNNNVGDKLPGNTFICGQTGSGKTVALAFLLLQATRIHKLRILLFDKDRGCEALIRAMGGRYRQLRRGQPTGFNPFQWEPTDRTVKFTERLIMDCVRRGEDDVLDVRLENQLIGAVRQVFSLPNRANRRISALLQFVGDQSELGQRLAKWCRTQSKIGANAWVLDNALDTTDFSGCAVFGFDYTDFLDDDEVGPIILGYILEAADTLIDGNPFIYVMEEFAKMVNAKSQTLVDFARDKQTTIRKLNGVGVFVTQSPSQVNGHPIGATLREQCVTQIYLPNPGADYADYVEGFKLTPTEFATIRGLALDSRMFLVKQGQRSVLCELDLGGMNDELEVMSGTLDNVMLLDRLRAQVQSDDPAVWMPPFLSAVRARRTAAKAVELTEKEQ